MAGRLVVTHKRSGLRRRGSRTGPKKIWRAEGYAKTGLRRVFTQRRGGYWDTHG